MDSQLSLIMLCVSKRYRLDDGDSFRESERLG